MREFNKSGSPEEIARALFEAYGNAQSVKLTEEEVVELLKSVAGAPAPSRQQGHRGPPRA